MSPFGAMLRTFRTATGLSQCRLGYKAGIPQNLISIYESGKITPQRKNVLALATALDLSEQDRHAFMAVAGHDLTAAEQDAAIRALVKERDAALDKVARLQSLIDNKDARIRNGRAAYARAMRRAINAERERDALDEQIGAHRASKSHVDDSEPDTGPTVYALEYLELMRAHRIIRRLLTADDGRDAAVGNRMLAKIQEINDAVDVKQNRGRAA